MKLRIQLRKKKYLNEKMISFYEDETKRLNSGRFKAICFCAILIFLHVFPYSIPSLNLKRFKVHLAVKEHHLIGSQDRF